MGKLLKALSPISSYAAKKGTTWDDVTDRIEGAMFPAMLDEVEVGWTSTSWRFRARGASRWRS